jgi:hypothetical protein
MRVVMMGVVMMVVTFCERGHGHQDHRDEKQRQKLFHARSIAEQIFAQLRLTP